MSESKREENFKKFDQRTPDGLLHYSEAIKAREGLTAQEIAETFDTWVEKGTYESDAKKINYAGPVVTAEAIAKLFDKNSRGEIKILDVAAGTGLLSKELRVLGFKNIDAVDPSRVSKEVAMKAGLYGRYVVDFVDDHPLDIESEEYDCVACSGGFAAGLMPCTAFKEMVRVVKLGGYVCFSVPEYIFTLCEEYKDKFEPALHWYETRGLWQRISKTEVKSYLDNQPGLIYVFKKLKSFEL